MAPADPLSKIAYDGAALRRQTEEFIRKWADLIPKDRQEEFAADYARTLSSMAVCMTSAHQRLAKRPQGRG